MPNAGKGTALGAGVASKGSDRIGGSGDGCGSWDGLDKAGREGKLEVGGETVGLCPGAPCIPQVSDEQRDCDGQVVCVGACDPKLVNDHDAWPRGCGASSEVAERVTHGAR